MNIEIGLENRLWKDSISKNQKEFILKMFTLPNAIPITPHLMGKSIHRIFPIHRKVIQLVNWENCRQRIMFGFISYTIQAQVDIIKIGYWD